jgi:glycosyltransferase involved in cell wall biosynthesis
MGVWTKSDFVSIFFKYVEKFTIKKADSVITLSPKTEKYLCSEYGYINNVYIPNSVDIAKANENISISEIDASISEIQKLKNEGKFLCIFTGAIVHSNNIGMFVDSARKLTNKNILIVIIGQGQERPRYEKIVKDDNLKNIIFLDPVTKKLVPKLLSFSDTLLLVQDNVQWGSSNKLYDYLAAKKPIITSLYANHNNIVENIECGFSSKHGDSDDLTNKIEKIYRIGRKEREKMGHNAFKYVHENHDIGLMANKLEIHLTRLTGES